ncbi:MAG: CADD family putative folate metabolism protein [Elusimicrobiota bacterium]
MKKNEDWWASVEAVIAERSLLDHPFYQSWTRGDLTRQDIAWYACQYYQQESRFSRFVSAVHSACPELKIRQALLENLNEEELGPDNHAELWLRFAQSVGVARDVVVRTVPAPETAACVDVFESLARDPRWQVGLAALYAYEAQQPAVAKTKIEGLKTHYGLERRESLGFFEAHLTADAWHSEVERKILREEVDRDLSLGAVVKDGVARACDALNVLLDGVCRARGVGVGALN